MSATELLAALAAAVGADRVSTAADARTTEHVSGRDLGRPLAWVRPRDAEACADAVAACDQRGARVVPIGDATTFWDGLHVGGAVVVDTRALAGSCAIDAERRLAHAGAGVALREIDRAARRVGLCLPALPDASGDTPVGALLAVGATAGLGMGRCLPVESVTGARLVTGDGRLVRAGTAYRLSGRAFVTQGLPDLLGLVAAAEGRAALVTDVGLRLAPALPSCRVEWAARPELLAPAALLETLACARGAMDRERLETLRIETEAPAGQPAATRVLARTIAPSGDEALGEARRLATAASARCLQAPAFEPESDEARAGDEPGYSRRYTIPAGEHRARLGGLAFWGVEINASWGGEAAPLLERMLALFDACARLGPRHRRLGIYPGRHVVSIGVQLLVERSPTAIKAARSLLGAALVPLLELGAVPYRRGRLWADALDARVAAVDATTSELVERCLRLLDPRGTIDPRGARHVA